MSDFPPNTTALDACCDLTSVHGQLVALGFDTIFRYCAPGAASAWKVIKPAEAKSMAAHGLKLALIYESTAKDVLFGTDEGAKAGAFAASFAPIVGLPPGIGAAIYPTADFDLAESQVAIAVAYLRAFAAACPGYDFGFYANGIGNNAAYAAGVISYRWLTQSGGFTGTQESLASGQYEIAQRLPAKVAGMDVDPNSLRLPGLEIGARVPWGGGKASA